jgi:pimeloyl-ACP methyl ester carboxylesterase
VELLYVSHEISSSDEFAMFGSGYENCPEFVCKLLMNYGFGGASFVYFETCNFSRENTNRDVSVFMFDLRMINMSSECEYD